MSEAAAGIDIKLMGRSFSVSCPDGEKQRLLAAVDYVNRKISEIRDSGKVMGNERIALMAALNIAHDFLGYKAAQGFDSEEFRRRMNSMQAMLNEALTEQTDCSEPARRSSQVPSQ